MVSARPPQATGMLALGLAVSMANNVPDRLFNRLSPKSISDNSSPA